jgi:hypothetical protein
VERENRTLLETVVAKKERITTVTTFMVGKDIRRYSGNRQQQSKQVGTEIGHNGVVKLRLEVDEV